MKVLDNKISLNSLKKTLKEIMKKYSIEGECRIPLSPDEEGDYFIVIYADNIKSPEKAINLSLQIKKILSEKFGDNIVVSVVPA